jgi:hypothetical protein
VIVNASITEKIRYVEKLDKSDIQELFAGNILALRYPGFCSESAAAQISKAMIEHKLFKQYQDNRGFGRLGQGFIELLFGAPWESYVSTKNEVMEAFQVERGVSPIDKLQTELVRAWGECTIPAHQGHTLRQVMGRVMREGGQPIVAHDDYLKNNVAQFPWADSQKGQLAVNVYISVPEVGGELVLWDMSLLPHEYDRLRLQRSDQRYGLDEKQLPPPSATLKPMLGELILINSCKLHGIRAVILGQRVTLASFVGYTSPEKPLWLWS